MSHPRKNGKGWIWWIAVVTIVAVGGYIWYGKKQAGALQETQYVLAEVAQGTVRKSVSATGTLQPWTVVDIKSKAGGKVLSLDVDLGSEVKAGQNIARIDPADSLVNEQTARADTQSADAKLKQNSISYTLQKQTSEVSISSATADLNSANANLEAAQARYKTAQDQAAAQPTITGAAINQSLANYNNVLKQQEQLKATQAVDKASAQAAYDQAQANFKQAESNAARQNHLVELGYVSKQVAEQADAAKEVAQAALNSAAEHQRTIVGAQVAEAEAMKARVEQAAAQLSSAKSQPDIQAAKNAEQEAKSAVAQVQASVRRAQMGVNQAIANRQNNELRKYDIDAAKASIARSQATLKNAEVTLNQTVVTAPENGVVLQKYVEQGTIITSGLSLSSTGTAIVQIGDVSRMYVNVTVDETDIASIEEGQTVDVSFDAYPGVPFEGKVTRVNPQATVLQNVTTVGVRVEVDNSSPSFRLLKPGMNAACDFVVDQKENVLTVPPDAVRSDDKGSYVDVATGGRPAPKTPDSVDGALVDVKKEHRSIEIGIEGNESVEVVKGLKAGEKVVAQEIAPVQANATGGSPFGGGGGRGGMGGGFGGGRGGR